MTRLIISADFSQTSGNLLFQHMVKQILGIKTALGLDASDALAIALTHAQHQRWQAALNKSTQKLT